LTELFEKKVDIFFWDKGIIR